MESVTVNVITFSPTSQVTLLPFSIIASPKVISRLSKLSSSVASTFAFAVVAVPVYVVVAVAKAGLNVTPPMVSPFNPLRLTEGLLYLLQN